MTDELSTTAIVAPCFFPETLYDSDTLEIIMFLYMMHDDDEKEEKLEVGGVLDSAHLEDEFEEEEGVPLDDGDAVVSKDAEEEEEV